MRPPQRALVAAMCSAAAASTCMVHLSAVRAARARRLTIFGFDKERQEYGAMPRCDFFSVLMIYKTDYQNEFRMYTRLQPATFDALVARLEDTPTYVGRKGPRKRGRPHKFSVAYEVALGLYVLSGRQSYHRVSGMWGCGGKSVVRTIVRRFVKAVCELEPEVIRWPDEQETKEIQEGFRALKPGLPLCVGAIDCVHVEISRPKKDPGDYICRKKRYSVNTQAIVDHRGLFLDVFCGWPGRAHDARVFKNSRVSNLLRARCLSSTGSCKSYIIGDSAYARRSYMLVGHSWGPNMSEEQSVANAYISNARVVVENAFGRLKARFRSLKFLDVATTAVPHWILATMILHNFIERIEGEYTFVDAQQGEAGREPLEREDLVDHGEEDSSAGKALLAKITAYIKDLRAARAR